MGMKNVTWRNSMTVNYPSMNPKKLSKILQDLGYKEIRQRTGSHRHLSSPEHPSLTLALHTKEIPPGLVKKILEKDIGLTEDEIKNILNQK